MGGLAVWFVCSALGPTFGGWAYLPIPGLVFLALYLETRRSRWRRAICGRCIDCGFDLQGIPPGIPLNSSASTRARAAAPSAESRGR
jgi:hypothetical protein